MLRAAAASAALLAGTAFPLAARAATTTTAPPAHYRFETRLAGRFSAGAYGGTLTLTIYPNGILQGLYRPDDGSYRTVTGGLDGQNIWLDIGAMGRLHLTGTFANGVLDMVAAIPGAETYTFTSVGAAKRTD